MSTILQDLSQTELLAKVAELQRQNELLRKARQGKVTIKIGEKGGLCFYGFGQRPIHMYAEQWKRLDAERENVAAFIEANRSELSWKHEQA